MAILVRVDEQLYEERDFSRNRPAPDVAGARVRIPLLRLGAVTGGVMAKPGVLVLKYVDVRLTGTAAGILNQTFNAELFCRGLLIEQATVIARTGVWSGLQRGLTPLVAISRQLAAH